MVCELERMVDDANNGVGFVPPVKSILVLLPLKYGVNLSISTEFDLSRTRSVRFGCLVSCVDKRIIGLKRSDGSVSSVVMFTFVSLDCVSIVMIWSTNSKLVFDIFDMVANKGKKTTKRKVENYLS